MSRNCLRVASHSAAIKPALRALGGLAFSSWILSAVAVGKTQDAAPAAPAGSSMAIAPTVVDWKYTSTAFSSNPASPIVSGNTVYFASGGKVYALNLQTGGRKWTYPSDGFMVTSVQQTPTLSGDTLFLPAGDGLYALNTADGHLKYPAFKVTRGGVGSTPTVVGSNVYFASSDGRLYGLNSETGDPLSTNFQKGLNLGSDLAGNTVSNGSVIYYVTSNQTLYAVDATTGVQKWKQPVTGSVESATPVLSGDFIYLNSGQLLTCWRSDTGQKLWGMTTRSDITAPPAVDSAGNVYIVTAARGVYALDARRQPIWKQVPVVDYEVDTQPIVAGNLLIVGTSQGGLYAFDRTNGNLVWNYSLQPTALDPTHVPVVARVTNVPVLSGDRMFVLTDDGTLTAFRHGAADTIAPSVKNLEPEMGEYCNGRPPFTIQATISDDGSGLDASSITLKLDEQAIPRRNTRKRRSISPASPSTKTTVSWNTRSSRTIPGSLALSKTGIIPRPSSPVTGWATSRPKPGPSP